MTYILRIPRWIAVVIGTAVGSVLSPFILGFEIAYANSDAKLQKELRQLREWNAARLAKEDTHLRERNQGTPSHE
mgnify:CR=1 FL=1